MAWTGGGRLGASALASKAMPINSKGTTHTRPRAIPTSKQNFIFCSIALLEAAHSRAHTAPGPSLITTQVVVGGQTTFGSSHGISQLQNSGPAEPAKP